MKPLEKTLAKNELGCKDLPKYTKVERVPCPDASIFVKFEDYLEKQAIEFFKKNGLCEGGLKNLNGE
jgi:hypothetical protein